MSEAEKLLKLLEKHGWSLATAESCTGGMAASDIVDVPGASEVYKGGVVAYANEAKVRALGVREDILEEYGAVSAECAKAMAQGARSRFAADCAFSTTGVAGPAGGTPDKPVGTVWIAAATPVSFRMEQKHFEGTRQSVRRMAVDRAISLLIETITESDK
ncbi:MAG: CinA family protein [Victivallaceae bacterium]|nr:CinA family protein [Victivallaceae bacterium]